MPNDMTPPPRAITLIADTAFLNSMFAGVNAREFTAKHYAVASDKDDDGIWMMLKLVPVQSEPVAGRGPSPEAAMARVAQGIADAMPAQLTRSERIIAEITQDPATHDVAAYLIKPLMGRDPPLLFEGGTQREVLFRTALKFKTYGKKKLIFAASHLLKGKHQVFPDFDEIFAALGRYDAHMHAKGDVPEAEEESHASGRVVG